MSNSGQGATSPELQTINNELNNKQELLARANTDLQNLLDSTQIPTVFLDDQLRIRHFTPEIRADVDKVQREGTIVERDLALKDGAHVFMMLIRPYRTAKNAIDGVVVIFVDITEHKRGEERQLLLAGELQHRTNNLLAVIQSVVGQSLSGTQSLADARDALTTRLHSLANANALLTQTNWYGATLEDVIVRELASFKAQRCVRGQQDLRSMLVIHELCTNAAKYGALSTPTGKIEIRWPVEEGGNEPRILFRWQERGGPPSAPPRRMGFGTTLLNSAISGGDGAPRIEYAPESVRYTLDVPLSSIVAKAGGNARGIGRPSQ